MICAMFSTLVDFEPYPSYIVFLPRCNLRCDYCYNHSILTDNVETISYNEALKRIEDVSPFIAGVVISGGEPTLYQNELYDFMLSIKKMGLKLKLDSNLTIELEDRFVELLDGVSFTIKPSSYYTRFDHIDNIRKNIRKLSHLPWKEVRITIVRDDFNNSLYTLAPLLKDWKINVHNAIVPETGTLASIEALDYDEFRDFVQSYISPYFVAKHFEVNYV